MFLILWFTTLEEGLKLPFHGDCITDILQMLKLRFLTVAKFTVKKKQQASQRILLPEISGNSKKMEGGMEEMRD